MHLFLVVVYPLQFPSSFDHFCPILSCTGAPDDGVECERAVGREANDAVPPSRDGVG